MRRCEICESLIPEDAHHRRKICFSTECKKERARQLDTKYRKLKREKIEMRSIEPPKVERKRIWQKEGGERKEIFDQLKKNPRDREARKWLKKKHITFVMLSLEDGRKVEVRV